MQIALIEPEIPQNTGNIARTCAALGAKLHLVGALGFDITEKAVRRAGLDYWHLLDLEVHERVDDFFAAFEPSQVVLFSSKAARSFTEIHYRHDSVLVFGNETRGLRMELLGNHAGPVVRIPTRSEARCLNLSNAVAVAAYEAERQLGYPGLQKSRDLVQPVPPSNVKNGKR